MTPGLILTHAAQLDIAEVASWYAAFDPALSSNFRQALADTLRGITDRPDAYTVVAPGLRRALLRVYPYAVYYRRLHHAVQIVAVLHTSRHRRIWRQSHH